MRHKAIAFDADYYISNGRMTVYYDPDGGSCFVYPEPMQVIEDIDVKQLCAALGIKDMNNLQYALDRLPQGESSVVRLKNFCDEHDIHYTLSPKGD